MHLRYLDVSSVKEPVHRGLYRSGVVFPWLRRDAGGEQDQREPAMVVSQHKKMFDKDILKMSGWPSEDNRIGEVSEKVETATNHFVKTLALQMRTLPTSS
jgi:hypothetical protein